MNIKHQLIFPTHEAIATRYFKLGGIAIFLGILLSIAMRIEMQAIGTIFSPEIYRILSLSHGLMSLIAIFLLMYCAFGHLLLPKELGIKAKFLRLVGVLSFWMFALALLLLVSAIIYVSLYRPKPWTLYPPLTESNNRPEETLLLSACLIIAIALAISAIVFIQSFVSGWKKWTLSSWAVLVMSISVLIYLGDTAYRLYLVKGDTFSGNFNTLQIVHIHVLEIFQLPVLLLGITLGLTAIAKTRMIVPVLWIIGMGTILLVGTGISVSLLSETHEGMLRDTTYTPALSHMTIYVTALFAFLAAWYAYFGEITGKTTHPLYGIFVFITMTAGVMIAFVPMFLLGARGMPRRIGDYPEAYEALNFISSIGSYIIGFGVLIFLVELLNAKKIAK